MHQSPSLAWLLLLAVVPSATGAQIVTDRPDFVDSSRSLSNGVFQLESGLSVTESGSVNTWSTPVLLRYGMGSGWEVRVDLPGFIRVDDPVDVTGFGDAGIGVKKAFPRRGDSAPTYGLLAQLDLPTGTSDVSQDGVRPSLRGVVEWGLSPLLSAGVMAGLRSDRAGDERYTAGLLGGVLGQSWSSEFRTYTELALSQIAGDDFGGNVGTLDVGGAYLLDDDSQLDVALAFGLTDAAPDFALGVGFSRRFR